MEDYKLHAARDSDPSDFETIYHTHPAQPGTEVVYAETDSTCHSDDVILWGVLCDGSPVPITMGGVWDGTGNKNKFVRFPSGRCAGIFEESWNTVEAAIEAVKDRQQ